MDYSVADGVEAPEALGVCGGVRMGVEAMGHLLLDCEEKASCQLGGPFSTNERNSPQSMSHKALGPEKVPK